jgi:hypothetical protein
MLKKYQLQRTGLFFIGGLLISVIAYSFFTNLLGKPQGRKQVTTKPTSQPIDPSLKFFRADNNGRRAAQGVNYVLIFDPKSEHLDFKVSLGLKHPLYATDSAGKILKRYAPKQFHEIITDQNALLNGRRPIAAINADYIDPQHHPQGLNNSRGIKYSGDYANKRSSFGISGGKPSDRVATIQIGRRKMPSHNYNLAGGNGRFYTNGKFKDICQDLGEYACKEEISRSMAAITTRGYVIWLVNNAPKLAPLFPDRFDDVLQAIAQQQGIGKIQDALLFDGGRSTGFYFNGRTDAENTNPIGSVFLIYQTN